MEENLNDLKYEIDVPYNNELLVKERKKSKITVGVCCFVGAAFFLMCTILSLTGNNPSSAATLIFVCFDVVLIALGLFYVLTTKPRAKDDNKTVKYCFLEDGLQIHQDNSENAKKNRTLEACLYRRDKHKQYIAKIFESPEKFTIRIFTGTYNGVAQYHNHVIPKSMLGTDEELSKFTEFLKSKLLDDYVVKNK